MPFSQQGFGDLGSAVGDIFGGIGQFAAASGYQKAAGYAELNADIAAQSAAIKEYQASRNIYRTLGGQRADVAGAGFAESGSAIDLLRDSAAQGALTKQVISNQGLIDVMGYKAEASAYSGMANAAKASGTGDIIGGAIDLAAAAFAFFSDDRMKEDARLVARRRDGLGIYHFRYKGSPVVFEGVMASEVERLYPRAVTRDEEGLAMVRYDLIGVEPRVVG